MPWVSLKELNKQTGFAIRSLQYIRAQEPGVLITRERAGKTEYQQPECATNLFRREREIAKREVKAPTIEDARARKIEAEAREAEIRVAQLLGRVIPTDIHEEVVGDIADRLRAVLVNVPANYGLRLEQLGVSPIEAERVLEEITLELTKALLVVADELESDVATNGDSSAA